MGFLQNHKASIHTILALSFPVIIEATLQTLLGTTDIFFAGRISDLAIAAIGVTGIVMNILISFFMALGVGAVAVISRLYGRQNFHEMTEAISQAIFLALSVGVFSGVICFLFRHPALRLIGATDEVIAVAEPYFLIVAVPSVVLCLQLVLSSCLRAISDTVTPMWVTGFSNILNILLNILFIYWGLGIFGLGLATTLSRAIGALLLFLRLWHHDPIIHLERFHINFLHMKNILRIGFPAGLEKLIMRIGQVLYNGMILSIGITAYVAHNVAGTIESYSYIPTMGFGLAAATLVGISLGEGNVQQARNYTNLSYLSAVLPMLLIGACFFVFAPQLAAIFTQTEAVQEQVIAVLRIIAFFQPFSALVQVMTNALQGAGDTVFPMWLTFFGIWGIRLFIGYCFGVVLELGLVGVWYAYVLDLLLRGSLLYLRFWRGKWQYIQV